MVLFSAPRRSRSPSSPRWPLACREARGLRPRRRSALPGEGTGTMLLSPHSRALYPYGDVESQSCSIRLPARRPVAQDMIDVDRHSASAYARPSEGRRRSRLAVHETSSAEPEKPRLLDRVRTALRSRHYSRRTEEAYVAWIRRYILHGKRHPMEMGAPEITRFLSFLAVDGKVAASTQNQALSALLFLCREV